MTHLRETAFVRRARISVADEIPSASESSVSVALVTDDDNFAEVCMRVLQREGYAARRARHSGHAMLACMEARVDILISELSMADGSGPALMRRMRRYNPELRSLYLAQIGATYDADNVLVRPFTRDDLLRRLESLAATCRA
jgi:DNA-binding response OmpR family regulator